MLKIAYAPILPGQTGHEVGRQLLRRLYTEETGQPLPEIASTKQGKPYFVADALHFSISHTRHHTFCALSDIPVGIDAEALDRNIDLGLAGKILSATERAQFDAAEDPRLALLTFWVLKEAYAKYTDRGFGNYLFATRFSLDDPRVTRNNGCLVAVIKEDAYAV